MLPSDAALSLLWPPGCEQAFHYHDSTDLINDLNLRLLIRRLSYNPSYERFVRDLLLTLVTDEQIIHYRQAILADLLSNEALVLHLQVVLETILDLERYLGAPQWVENPLRQVAWRLSELDNYVTCMVQFDEILQAASEQLQSDGLQRLRDMIHEIVQAESFIELQQSLPDLLPKIRAIRSITIGINLDEQLRPVSATLLDANIQPVTGSSILNRLLRREKTPEEGAGPLHNARDLNTGGAHFQVELEDRNSPFMPQLFKDLSELMEATSRPIAQALRRYTHINTRFLIALKDEIAFYLGAVKMIQSLQQAGLPMCAPEVAPMPSRIMHMTDLYNVNLALQLQNRQRPAGEVVVRNDAIFDDDIGRIYILTGPNQGGKTTYTQAVGLAYLLMQAGLHVPAVRATLSAVDGIYTHFATEERPEQEAGRLGEEARRLSRIFEQATRYSLVLLNESLASTAADESLFIAQDVVRVLRKLGARAVFATHLHNLAAECEQLNAQTEGDSRVVSIVSHVALEEGPDGQVVRRTYEIKPGPPVSRSYAVELAARYGISYEQLMDVLRQRQLLD